MFVGLNQYFDDTNNTTSISLQNPYYNYSNTVPHNKYIDLISFYMSKRPNILVKPTILARRYGGTKTKKNKRL